MSSFADNIIKTLKCQLAWLLTLDNDVLVTSSIATGKAPELVQHFRATLRRYYDAFPFVANDNPPAQVLLKNTPMFNVSASYIDQIPGGIPLVHALTELGVNYVSFVPLFREQEPFGVLIIGAEQRSLMDSTRDHQLIELFGAQAITLVDQQIAREALTTLRQTASVESGLRQILIDAATYPMAVIDDQHTIIQVNQHLLSAMSTTEDEVLGKDIEMIFASEGRSSAMYSIVSNDNSALVPRKLVSQNGHEYHAALFITPIAGSGFKVIHFRPVSDEDAAAFQPESQRLRALTRASQALTSALSLHELMDVILSSALEVVNGVEASILLIDFDNPDELVYVSTRGPFSEEMPGRHVPLGVGIVGWVAEEGKAQIVSNVRHDPRFQFGLDCHEDMIAQTLAAIPLKTSDSVIGVLIVVNKQDGVFDDNDLEVLESLGSSAAVAIQNASLFDQTTRRLSELTTLLEASAAVTSTLELDDILQHITRRLLNTLEVQQVTVAIETDTGDTLSVLASMVDASWHRDSRPSFSIHDHPIKQLTVEQRMITQADITQEDLTDAERHELAVRGMGIVLNLPLRVHKETIGVVCLYHPDPRYSFDTIEQSAVADAMEEWIKQGKLDDITALVYRCLQATTAEWSAVYFCYQKQLTLVREIGTNLTGGHDMETLWGLHEYPTMQHVVSTGEPTLAWVDDLDEDAKEQQQMHYTGMQASLMVPLIMRGKSSGIVKLATTGRRLFDSGELSLVQGIANSVGNALENASLYKSLEQRARTIEAAFRDLESADQLKDNLLQNLSHEISTPLMHILGYVNLLRDGEYGDLSPQQQEVLEQVVSKSDHIAEIVRDMVAAYATRSGPLNVKRVKLEHIAALAVRSLAGKAKAAGIRIIPHIEENLPRVYVDQGLIGQALEALLDNAIKFSHPESTVEVILRDTNGPMLEACVRDYGIGIPAEEQDKIFMRFYQVHGGTARRFEGTGLGLSIAYDVISSHGGRLWVESEESKGTAVFFTVPKANLANPSFADED
ncbi:MAG: GAF domain-containing protein [Chloroflexi bacterium]|nr:GAF domain-containing protein [Chloroflexota bacterium]